MRTPRCLGVSRPFVSDTLPKCIDREGLKRRRTGTRQARNILGDLGADSEGEEKSKQAGKKWRDKK